MRPRDQCCLILQSIAVYNLLFAPILFSNLVESCCEALDVACISGSSPGHKLLKYRGLIVGIECQGHLCLLYRKLGLLRPDIQDRKKIVGRLIFRIQNDSYEGACNAVCRAWLNIAGD